MNPLLTLEVAKANFSPSELAIYEVIKEQPSLVTHLTTTALAEMAGVSQPTLTRFVKNQLGYARYQDFRFDFINWLSTNTDEGIEKNDYFNRLQRLITISESVLNEQVMNEIVGVISESKHVFVTGSSKSYLSAKLFETLMRKTGTFVVSYSIDSLDDAASYLHSDDLMIIFSASGNSSFIKKIVDVDTRKLLITANPNSKYAELLDKIVILPSLTGDWEYDSVSPILFNIFTELLVTQYAKLVNVKISKKIEPVK